MIAGHEEIFTHKSRAFLVPRPTVSPATICVGLVGKRRIGRHRAGNVMAAVHRQRLQSGRAAAINHHGPRRVRGLDSVGHLRNRSFIIVHLRAATTQVDNIDVGKLVFDCPDLDARMISLGFDLLEHLIAPVLHQLRFIFRAGALNQILVRLPNYIVHAFAVQHPIPANDHAVAVKEVQRLPQRQAQTARDVALPRHLHPVSALVGLLVKFQTPLFIVGAKCCEVGPHRPDHAVEFKVDAVDRPLAEAKRRLQHVHRLTGHADGGAQ